MLFALSAHATHFAAAEHEVMIDLDLRCELNDAWLAACSGRREIQPAGGFG